MFQEHYGGFCPKKQYEFYSCKINIVDVIAFLVIMDGKMFTWSDPFQIPFLAIF